MNSTRFQTQLLLQLTRATSRQEVLDELLIRNLGLRSVTLWWQADGVQTAICNAGGPRAESAPFSLPGEPRYLLSVTPGFSLSEEVLAVMTLRLVHLDAQGLIATLTSQRSTLEVASRTDSLTGLRNRRAFDADLDGVDAAGGSFAVVFIDLDGFKELNDRHGHEVGDAMLRGYGHWLTRMIGSWGAAYRLGGDEFLLLVSGYPDSPDAFRCRSWTASGPASESPGVTRAGGSATWCGWPISGCTRPRPFSVRAPSRTTSTERPRLDHSVQVNSGRCPSASTSGRS
jgi:diguanylate cyclase